MTWREKIERVKALLATRDDLIPIFDCTDGAPRDFIEGLRGDYAFLPPEYLAFLAFSDGAQLGTFVLSGSGRSAFPGVRTLIKRWVDLVDVKNNVPVCEDASGATFFIGKAGGINLVGTDPPVPERVVASAFEVFLRDVLMGAQYPSLFPRGTYPGDKWLELLREQGWV